VTVHVIDFDNRGSTHLTGQSKRSAKPGSTSSIVPQGAKKAMATEEVKARGPFSRAREAKKKRTKTGWSQRGCYDSGEKKDGPAQGSRREEAKPIPERRAEEPEGIVVEATS